MWELYFPILLQFTHCRLWESPFVWTVRPAPVKLERLKKLEGFFDREPEEEE